MGLCGSSSQDNPVLPSNSRAVDQQMVNRPKRKVLCIHGFRTSGDIFYMQTAALRYNTGIEGSFPNAPFPASGPIDPGVLEFYEGYDYFEWYCKHFEDMDKSRTQKDHSIQFLIKYVEENGPFDGILGFSQGGAVVTLLLHHFQTVYRDRLPFSFAILIGGVEPSAFIQQVRFGVQSSFSKALICNFPFLSDSIDYSKSAFDWRC